MALALNDVGEVRFGGSDTNGGLWRLTGTGTDYSQQNSPQWAVTDAVANGTTTITSATASFTSAVVGNGAYINGAHYIVVGYTNSTTITVDRNVTTGSGLTLNIGGALASIGKAYSLNVTSSLPLMWYVKRDASNPYVLSTATAGAGGPLSGSNGGVFIGYDTNRSVGNTDTKPIIKAGVNTITWFNSRCTMYNLELDGDGKTGQTLSTNADQFIRCTFKQFTAGSLTSVGSFDYCYATNNSGKVFSGSCSYCVAYANTGTPFGADSCFRCASINNTGATTDGFSFASGGNGVIECCLSYGNGRHGIYLGAASRTCRAKNCILVNNGGYGLEMSANSLGASLNNAYRGNTSGQINKTANQQTIDLYGITLTADPFTNAAGLDFTLNNTAGGGALLRELGLFADLPGLSPANYFDLGPYGRQSTGGGGSTFISRGLQSGGRM
jgi:hypothetical protein